jgi:flagellin-like protein
MAIPHAEDAAVSPVVGVVLMVAITVVLAAVVGTIALGVDAGTETPNAVFGFEPLEKSGQPDELRIVHEGGDEIRNTDLYVRGSAKVQDEDGTPSAARRISWYAVTQDDGASEGESVGPTDSALVEPPDGDPELEGKTFTVLWDDGETAVVLDRWEG